MTAKEYVKAHKGMCYEPASWDPLPIRYLVKWYVPKDRNQRVCGFHTKEAAEATAGHIAKWPARVSVVAVR